MRKKYRKYIKNKVTSPRCLLHHTTIGTAHIVDFVPSAYQMTTFLPHVFKIKQTKNSGVSLGYPQKPFTFDVYD